MSHWIEQEFALVDLGDKRLEERLRRVVERMWQSPQSAISAACGTWSETMAAYRLFDNEGVTVDQILAAHQSQVATRRQSRLAYPGHNGTGLLQQKVAPGHRPA
jgi:peptidyl-tRNA hydrolase